MNEEVDAASITLIDIMLSSASSMPETPDHTSPLRLLLLWLRTAALFGLVTGLVVYLIVFGLHLDIENLLWSIGIGLMYASGMWGVQQLLGNLLIDRVPLDSRGAVAVHVLVQSLAVVASFLLMTLAVDLLTGLALAGNRGLMAVIALIALCVSILVNGTRYLDLFYHRLRAAEQAALRAELQALRAQINPHFLFNSLNSIAALIRIRPAEAEELTESLADLFRYSLRSSQHPTVRLAEELHSIDLYLDIERARFGERLRVTIDVPGSLHNVTVPSLILQPLVENAVRHGVGKTDRSCDVFISGRRSNGMMTFSVEDTGPGFLTTDPDVVFASGTGLRNVRDRLRHLFGKRAGMLIHHHGVELVIPIGGDGDTLNGVELDREGVTR
jgi:signal transduction histidine kinase